MYQLFTLGFILLITSYVLKRMRDRREPKLNTPPLVRYKFPIIGHTYNFINNSEELLKQCREEYGDIFSLYIWGQVRTFVGKEHVNEVFANDEVFDFAEAFKKLFPSDVMLKNLNFVPGNLDSRSNRIKILKETIFSKLRLYSGRMQKCLYTSTKERIGDCDEPKVHYKLFFIMAKIFSVPMANLLLGEELSKNEEVLATFSEFPREASIFFIIPPFLNFIYPGLHFYLTRLIIRLGLFNPATKHQNVLKKHIKKQVSKRLEEKEMYGDSWKRPNDFLQDILESDKIDLNNINYSLIVDILGMTIFASIHSTSMNSANAIIELASRPEYMQELYEEQLEVHKEADENGVLPYDALCNMKKLDSFIREALRLNGLIAGLQHYLLKDYTFSNGYQVPKDQTVDIYFDDVNRDELLQGSNPKSFEPFRHLSTRNSATRLTKSFLAFGSGKHACPGRFLAINEIKFFMHNLILKYNFRTESGKIEEKIKFSSVRMPSFAGIVFERRKN